MEPTEGLQRKVVFRKVKTAKILLRNNMIFLIDKFTSTFVLILEYR